MNFLASLFFILAFVVVIICSLNFSVGCFDWPLNLVHQKTVSLAIGNKLFLLTGNSFQFTVQCVMTEFILRAGYFTTTLWKIMPYVIKINPHLQLNCKGKPIYLHTSLVKVASNTNCDHCKVDVLFKGRNFLRNYHLRFDVYYIPSNLRWRFLQFLWPS